MLPTAPRPSSRNGPSPSTGGGYGGSTSTPSSGAYGGNPPRHPTEEALTGAALPPLRRTAAPSRTTAPGPPMDLHGARVATAVMPGGWAPGGVAVGAGDRHREEGRMRVAPCSARSICATTGHDVPCSPSIRRGGRVRMRTAPRRALAPPARSVPPPATVSPAVVDPPWREQGGATPGGAPTGRWRPGAREERRRERKAGGGGERERGTLMLTNFSHLPNWM
jgi:hypothetical protein